MSSIGTVELKVAICEKCKSSFRAESKSGIRSRFCSECIIKAAESTPNPDCEYCSGVGEYFRHSDSCKDEWCAYTDDPTTAPTEGTCEGEVISCNCSILDRFSGA